MASRIEIEIVDRNPTPQQPVQPGQPATQQTVGQGAQPVPQQPVQQPTPAQPVPASPAEAAPSAREVAAQVRDIEQAPGPGPGPPGMLPFPPGSAGEMAARWAQMGALSSPAGSFGGAVGTTPPVQIPQGADASALLPQREPPAVQKQERAEDRQPPEPPAGPSGEGGATEAEPVEEDRVRRRLRRTALPWTAAEVAKEFGLSEVEQTLTAFGQSDSPREGNDAGESAGLQRLLMQGGMGRLGNAMAMTDQVAENTAQGVGGLRGLAGKAGMVSAISGVIGGVTDTISGGILGMGQMAAGVISQNDGAVAVQQAIDGIEDFGRKIPIVGEAVGGALGLLLSPAKALMEVFSAMAERGKELAAYSPELAEAVAMQDVKQLMADIHEAQTMGGDYARMIELETEFNREWREAMLPIKKVIGESMPAFMEFVKPLLRAMAVGMNVVKDGVAGVATGFTDLASHFHPMSPMLAMMRAQGATQEDIRKTLWAMFGFVQDQAKKKSPDEVLADLYAVLGSGANLGVAQPEGMMDFFGGPAIVPDIVNRPQG